MRAVYLGIYMKQFERPMPENDESSKKSEHSGARRINENKRAEDKERERHREVLRKIAAKAEEEHPQDPWEQHGPTVEKDTASVWGVTEEEEVAIKREEALDEEEWRDVKQAREKRRKKEEAMKRAEKEDESKSGPERQSDKDTGHADTEVDRRNRKSGHI